jgi:hypothetical protein
MGSSTHQLSGWGTQPMAEMLRSALLFRREQVYSGLAPRNAGSAEVHLSPPSPRPSATRTTNGRQTHALWTSLATSGRSSSSVTSRPALAGSSSCSACCQGSRPSSCALA